MGGVLPILISTPPRQIVISIPLQKESPIMTMDPYTTTLESSIHFWVKILVWNGFYGSLSISTCVSRGIVPSDGSSPIAAGLIIGEEGKNYSHPFSGEDTFPTEHNQLLTAVLNLGYHSSKGFFAGIDGRLDSGLPFDLVGPNGKGLDAEQSRQLLLARGYTERVINLLNLTPESPGSPDKSVAPHVVVDAVVGYDFSQLLTAPVSFTMSILNVFDTLFLYKFESTFGATHFGYPRILNVTLSVKV